MKLIIENDSDVENPNEDGDWKFVSFNDRHINSEDPYKYLTLKDGEVVGANIRIARKLEVGTAFIVSCYEHSGFSYSLKGKGTQCRWDTTQNAGILLWTQSPKNMGAKTYAERQQDARNYLEVYDDWANGNCYQYRIEYDDGKELTSRGGYIGKKHLIECLKEDHPELFDEGADKTKTLKKDIEVDGEADWVLK